MYMYGYNREQFLFSLFFQFSYFRYTDNNAILELQLFLSAPGNFSAISLRFLQCLSFKMPCQ